jgi:hypothetical protein
MHNKKEYFCQKSIDPHSGGREANINASQKIALYSFCVKVLLGNKNVAQLFAGEHLYAH